MILGLTGRGRMGSEVERLARADRHEIRLSLDEYSNPDGIGLTKDALAGIEVNHRLQLAGSCPREHPPRSRGRRSYGCGDDRVVR